MTVEPQKPEQTEETSDRTSLPDEGLVAEIRHELEEVVEQVAPPVRWTLRKLLALSMLALVALVVLAIVSVVLYYANRTELVAHELTLLVNQTLTSRTDLRLEIDDVRGNPFQRVRFLRARVVYADGQGPPLLQAPAIDLGYTPWSLLRGGSKPVEIVIHDAIVRMERGPDGKLRIPLWKQGPRGEAGPPRIIHLVLKNARVVAPDPYGVTERLELDAWVSTGKGTEVRLERLAWRDGPFETRGLSMRGRLRSADSVHVQIDQLSTADLALKARGSWPASSQARPLHIDLERLTWRWLARVTSNRSFDVPGGARASVDVVAGRDWRGRFASRVEWNGLPLDGRGGFRWDGRTLDVTPLVATSPAGNLNGGARWARAGWQVGGTVQNGEPSKWSAIGIPGWPKGNLNGTFDYSVDTRARASHGTVQAQLGASELQGWRVDGAAVTVDLPPVGTRTFYIDAQRRGGTFTLAGATDAQGWTGEYVVERLPLDEWPDGRASGIRGILSHGLGTVSSRPGGLYVTGALAGESTDWLGMRVARWTMDDVNGALLPQPDLISMVRLRDVTWLSIQFDSVATPLAIGNQNVAFMSATANAGDTLIAASGTASWDARGWSVSMDRAEMRSPRFNWVAEPPVQFVGQGPNVVFQRLMARDGPARLAVRGRWSAGKGGSYDWRADVEDLDLSRLGLPPEWGLAGTTDGTLQVNGPEGNPHWALDAATSRPGWEGHRGDSLWLSLEGAPSRVRVRAMDFHLGAGRLEAAGDVERTRAPWPDSLTGPAVIRWLGDAASWRGQSKVSEFPLDRLSSLDKSMQGVGGALSGTLDVGGSPGDPELDLKLEVKPAYWRTVTAQQLDVRAHYKDQRLEVPDVRVTRGTLVSRASGSMGLALALGKPARALEQPMAWRADVQNGDLGLLPRLVPMIGWASGAFDLNASVTGTPEHPVVSGRARIVNGSARATGREEVLRAINGSMALEGDRITVDTLTARQGERGVIRMRGQVDLKGLSPKSWRLDVQARDFTASEQGVYAIQMNGNFTVTDGVRREGRWLPHVTGRADVTRAVVLYDFANQSEAQQLASAATPLYWTYRVDVVAKNNLHWQPPDGDVEFSADLTVEQTPSELRMFGDMRALRGTYYFLSNRFTVRKADLTFDQVGGVNPLLDVEAVTRVTPAVTITDQGPSGTSQEDQPHDVTVYITGRAREPLIAFASAPGDWDEPRILRELTVGQFVTSTGSLQSDPFDNFLTRAINRTLSDEMGQVFRGYVQEWSLERERGGLFQGQGDLIVGAGSQVTPNLMLRYRQRVPGLSRPIESPEDMARPFERGFVAEYRLNRFFYVTSELTQRRPVSSSPATNTASQDFNVNLKARWEW